MEQNNSFVKIPKIKIHPDYFVTYSEIQWIDPSKKPARKPSVMPSCRRTNGVISKRAAARIRKSVSWLLYISNDKTVLNSSHGKRFKFKLSFITLTLASKQLHDDKIIKTRCLNQFLIEARKKWGVVHYIWRAEPQINGNIHFHIVCDKFIPWSELRDCWNRIQNKLGYVDRYREEQRAYHSGGFKVRKKLLSRWEYKLQLKAYRTGSRLDWNSPNSTDIHSIFKIKNLPQYISKYCTKNEGGRQIEGNLWSLSESLSKLDGAIEILHNTTGDELNYIISRNIDKTHKHDYYTICYMSVDEWKSVINGELAEIFNDYVNQFKGLYT